MSKYDPLKRYLQAKHENHWIASFAEIEAILRSNLPASASKYREWWANEIGDTSHVQCRAWLDAGWQVVKVDQERDLVTLQKRS